MSDYIFCVSNPRQPGLIQLHAATDDPRIEASDAMRARRDMGVHTLEWTLPVVDRHLSEAALRKVLRTRQAKGCAVSYECDPMMARGEAIKLTTLRPDDKRAMRRRKRGFFARVFLRRAA